MGGEVGGARHRDPGPVSVFCSDPSDIPPSHGALATADFAKWVEKSAVPAIYLLRVGPERSSQILPAQQLWDKGFGWERAG